MKAEFLSFNAERKQTVSSSVQRLHIFFLSAMLLMLAASASAQKPQKHHAASAPAEEQECTAFPVYYCYPSGRPATPPTQAQISDFDQQALEAIEHPGPCIEFPQHSCAGPEESWNNPDVITPEEMGRYAVINQICTGFPWWHCDVRSLQSEGVLPPAKSKP